MADITDFKGSDIIDVRDIIARVEELRGERDDHQASIAEADAALDGSLENADAKQKAIEADAEWSNVYAEELETLESFLDGIKGYGGDEQWEGDWYPVTLIARSYFVDYCEELVKDIGDLPREMPSYLAIDWQATADNLEVDYSTVYFDGDEYLYR